MKKKLPDIRKTASSPLFRRILTAGAIVTAAAAAFTAVKLVQKRRSLIEGSDPKNLTRAKNIYISGNTLASYAAAAYLIKEGGYSGRSVHIYGVPAASVITEEYGAIGECTRKLMESLDARSDDDFSIDTLLENISYTAAPEVKVISSGEARTLSLRPDKAMLKALLKAFKRLAASDDASQISVAECFGEADGFFESDLFMFLEMTFGIRADSKASELLARVGQLTTDAQKAGLYDTLYYSFSTLSILEQYLEENGADIQRGAEISGVDAADNKVSAVHIMNEGTRMTIYLNREDFVILDTGSTGDGAADGSFNETAAKPDSAPASMALWQDAAAKDDSFGLPEMLLEEVPEYVEFSIVDDDGYLLKKICDKAGIEPDTGVSLLIADSSWRMKLTSEPYSLIPSSDEAMNAALETTADTSEEDITDQDISASAADEPQPVITVKGVYSGEEGNYIEKTMREATGVELLYELCCHLGLSEDWDEIAGRINTVMVTVLPYKNAPLRTAPSYAVPELMPCDNCAMAGDFVTTDAPSGTLEQQIQSARNAAYAILGKKVKKAKSKTVDLKKLI